MKVGVARQLPRRKALVSSSVDEVEVQFADREETRITGESAKDYVARLALQKAQTIADKMQDVAVIGSDTAVVIEGEILGKPENFDDSQRMLQRLSGKTHQVMTGFSVVTKNDSYTEVVTTDVTFTNIEANTIKAYWQSNEPQDKAGSYAIQGIGGRFVEKINGSVSSVIGLPLVELETALKRIL